MEKKKQRKSKFQNSNSAKTVRSAVAECQKSQNKKIKERYEL